MRLPEQASIALPGFAGPKTYAAWPVWKDSAREEIRFHPMPRKRAARLYHEARRYERQTRTRGRQDGAIGRNGLAILHALIFDCLNYASGRLDPSYETLARLANISIRSVARGLQKLKEAGVLHWVRRCIERIQGGRFTLSQDTNAYAVLPASQWNGYTPPPPPPPPDRGTWGDHPPLPTALDQAADELRQGGRSRSVFALLESDPTDGLANALARLGRTLRGQNA